MSNTRPLISIRQTSVTDVIAQQIATRIEAEFGHHTAEAVLLGLTSAWLSLVRVRAKVFLEGSDEECRMLFSAFAVTVAQQLLEIVGVCPVCWRQHGTSEDVVH